MDIESILASFERELDGGAVPRRAADLLDELNDAAGAAVSASTVTMPTDPFRGTGPSDVIDDTLPLTLFWRMFDRTPAAMVQGLALPLRRMLAKRIFRSCADDVIFHHNVLFSRGANISIGEGSLINRYVMLDDREDIDIGSYVMVAAGVTIETHTHPFDDFSVPIAVGGRSGKPVSIGSNTVLGYNTVVMAGVSIGYRCIVGANSVVTNDVDEYTVVGGVPAKPIKQLLPPAEGGVWTPGGPLPDR